MNEIDMMFFVLNSILMVGLTMTTASDVLILGSTSTRYTEQENSRIHCRYSKAYSMLQVRCSDPKLEEIPRDLSTDIKILDATSSRIRDLRNDSLSSYRNLAYIYLGDNFIQNIEESAFAQQHYLEVLDLTKNGCDYLPKNLFQLPYLRKIYLAVNKFGDSVFKTEVSSPLNFLQLHRNKLTKLPEMGYLPTLTHLNVSENMITKITTEELARFCSLEILDASKNTLNLEENSCECVTLKSWLKLRNITFKPAFNCTKSAITHCGNVTFSNETLTIYDECTNLLRIQISLLLIVGIGLAYCEPPLSNQYGYPGNFGGSGSNGNFGGSGHNGNFAGGSNNNNNNHRSHDGDHSYDDGHNGGDNQDYADNYPKSYEFGYAIKDAATGNDFGRRETSDGETVRGEYRVQLPDGRTQIVTYTADWRTGFHADVRYEGTATYPDQYNNNNNNNQGYDFQGNGISNGYNGGNNAGYNNNNNNYRPGNSNYNQNNYQFGSNALDNNYNFGDVTRNVYKPPVYGPPVG
ncbi:hypothetical protein KPH14_007671 [Odynerus spinipes]|uniref:Uncharacterized protein n=1 Tax=Odynerus spinipes TaxID=1348599 RepID=A0AAD9RJY6_9HYME|nr:hypothetical protein KPH14_007671 [Odynerus spinipes]